MATIEDAIKRIQELARVKVDELTARVILPAANESHALTKNRIMVDGENSSGSKLSDYSTKPAYFGKESFVKKSSFAPLKKAKVVEYRSTIIKYNKKTGKYTKGKTNFEKLEYSKGKTMYIEDGYKGLRKVQGMDTSVKNLTYSGDMMLSFVVGKNGSDIVSGFNNNEQAIKREAHEKRENVDIFHPTKDEIQAYKKEVTEAYKELLKIR